MSIGFEDLLKLAEGDYKMCLLAEMGFPDEYAVRGAVYHLQQAVEKALKAAVLINGETPPFTHNIAALANQCNKLGMELSQEFETIYDAISFWESISRYDPYFSFTQSSYQLAKALYGEIIQKVSEQCKKIMTEE